MLHIFIFLHQVTVWLLVASLASLLASLTMFVSWPRCLDIYSIYYL